MADKRDEIWKGDHLNRREDAGFLYAYLLQRNSQAVKAGEKGVSINVSAPWGAGKTFFMKRFAEDLRADGHRVAEVDAWRDDHSEDPIYAIMAGVLAGLGNSGKKGELRTALSESARKIAIRSGRGILKKGLALIIDRDELDGIGEDLAKAIGEAGKETISEYAEKALERFEEGQKAIHDFRAEIAREVKDKKPLYVLVDELDRCRPTYAVSVLERVKHLFDVPNVIFVFATNSDQLIHTIKAVYGAEFDATRYLHRFFDRTYQFDEPTRLQFVASRWEAIGLDNERFYGFRDLDHTEVIEKMSAAQGLSLRDIDQCMEMLWSISEFADPRMPVPLIYAYFLIITFHLRDIDAFEEASSLSGSIGSFPYISNFLKDTDLFELNRRSEAGKYYKDKVTVLSVLGKFVELVRGGLTDNVSGNGYAASHVNQYRSGELSRLHNGAWNAERLESALSGYRAMIKNAGRVSPTA